MRLRGEKRKREKREVNIKMKIMNYENMLKYDKI